MSRLIDNTIKAEWTNADALDLQPTCNQLATDCISRQAALDEINHELRCGAVIDQCGLETAYDLIEELPTAQPEIIRCKDCKNSEHWYRDRRRCFLWSEDGVSVFDDGFCNYAVRRTDE